MSFFKILFSSHKNNTPTSSQLLSSERWMEVETFINEHIDEIAKFKMRYASSGIIWIDYDTTKQFTNPLYATYKIASFFEERPGERSLTNEERNIMERRILYLLRNHGLRLQKCDLSHNDSTDMWYIVAREAKYKNPY